MMNLTNERKKQNNQIRWRRRRTHQIDNKIANYCSHYTSKKKRKRERIIVKSVLANFSVFRTIFSQFHIHTHTLACTHWHTFSNQMKYLIELI